MILFYHRMGARMILYERFKVHPLETIHYSSDLDWLNRLINLTPGGKVRARRTSL